MKRKNMTAIERAAPGLLFSLVIRIGISMGGSAH